MNLRLGIPFGLALVLAYIGGEWHGRRGEPYLWPFFKTELKTERTAGDFWIGTSGAEVFTTTLSGDVVQTWPDSHQVLFSSGDAPPYGPEANTFWLCAHSAEYRKRNVCFWTSR